MKGSNLAKLVVLLAIVATIQGLAIAYLLRSREPLPSQLGWWLFLIVLAYQLFRYLRSRWLPLFLLVQRWRTRIGNPAANWNLVVRMEGTFSTDVLKPVHDTLLSVYATRLRLLDRGTNYLRFVLDGFVNFEIVHQLGTATLSESVSVSFLHFRIGLRDSVDLLDKTLLPLARCMENMTNPTQTLFTLNVEFEPESNPFLGLYLRSLRLDDVTTFNVNLNIRDYQEKDVVTITKDSLTVSAYSASAFQSLSREFLSFSPQMRLP